MLRPGDLLVGPLDPVDELAAGRVVELECGNRLAVSEPDGVKVVLDWDGTVTETDGLHLVLLEFGDEKI